MKQVSQPQPDNAERAAERRYMRRASVLVAALWIGFAAAILFAPRESAQEPSTGCGVVGERIPQQRTPDRTR